MNTINENAIESAKYLISKKKATCVVIKNGEIINIECGSGIKPIIEIYEKGLLSGAVVVDKIVGKAAALIMVLGGVKACYGITMSKAAIECLKGNNISAQWENSPEYIINRKGDDICPMEKTIKDIEDPKKALEALKAKLARMDIIMNKDREYFLKTDRIGFSKWSRDDIALAELLWGNPKVTKFICADGKFSAEDIKKRLEKEIHNGAEFGVQYWPIFELRKSRLIGCCGLRPYKEKAYEIGFHLLPDFWGQGYAVEAANAVIDYAFSSVKAEKLFAGHNPNNIASQKLLAKLGFSYIGDEFYEPTGLYHPSYELLSNNWKIRA